jgi:CHAT domain-containing protein
MVRSVSCQQLRGTIQVQWNPVAAASGVPASTRSNRGGRLSTITFHVLGDVGSSTPAAAPAEPTRPADAPAARIFTGTLTVLNKTKSAAAFHISAGPLRVPTPEDAAMLEAERSEAAALATPHTVAGAQQSLPLLQAAESHWRYEGRIPELAQDVALETYNQAFPSNDGSGALSRLPELLSLAAQLETLDPTEAANARKTAGFVLAKQARYDDAMTQYNIALRLFEQTSDTFNQVVVLENRAKVERIQAQYASALDDVQKALSLTGQSGDARGELALEVERGAIATASGQLGLAYEADLRAVALAQSTKSPFLEGVAWSDLAVAYTELHDFPEASRALDHADAVWKTTADAYGQLQTLEDRAELQLAQGNLASARASFASGAEAAAKSSLPREQSYFLRGLAIAELRSGNPAEAAKHLDEATRQAEQAHVNDTLSALYASQGDVAASQHLWLEASAKWQSAATLAEQQANPLDEVIALGGLIRAALANHDLPLASQRCGRALTALESIRGAISDSDLRLSFFSSRHDLYDLCVDTALRRKDQQAAFDTAERGRARSLLDEAAAAGVLAQLPPALLQRMQKNEQELSRARRLVAARSAGKNSQARQNYIDLLRERDAIRLEADENGVSSRLAADALPLRQDEIVRKLDPATVLLAYWLGSDRSVVWLVTHHGASVYTLPPARVLGDTSRRYLAALLAPLTLDSSASAQQRSSLITASRDAATQQGLALRRTLLPMPLPQGTKRLLIVKDGALLPVSFSSLPLPGEGYLGERYQLAIEPSAPFAWRSVAEPRPFTQLRSVIFADPAPSGQRGQHEPPAPEIRRAAWTEPLPFAHQESEILRQTFGDRNTTIFSGPEATRSHALALDWAHYDVAHFATHALFRETHPELSGLVLAAPSSSSALPPGSPAVPSHDAILSFNDVLQMKAPLQLVVLNACSSGMGELLPGEGKLALDNAFLAAGTARVVATLWPVDDEASSVFMRDFYQALARTHSPTLSLQLAQREMAASEEWSAPYYWGSFTLTGDWHPLSN